MNRENKPPGVTYRHPGKNHRPSGENRPSSVPAHRYANALTNDENETVFRLLGPRCQSQATGVVQVFGTEPPYHNSWHQMFAGVATFTKDNERKSFYIQVYDIMEKKKRLEQEIYKDFEYHTSVSFFHQFEGEDRMIGLNFCDEGDAQGFDNAIKTLINNRKRRREERRREIMQQQQTKLSAGMRPQQQQQQQHHHQQQQQHEQKHHNSTAPAPHKDKKKRKVKVAKRDKKKFSKGMIGTPYDFQHVSHAGINNDNTCTVSNVSEDKELLNLFSVVGLDQTKLADDNTRKFVYDFIDKHGGIEEARAADRRYSTKRTMSHNLGNRIASAPTPPPPRVTASTGSINPPHSRVTASTGSINPPPPPRALPPVPPERLSFIHPSPPVNRHYQADRYVVDDGPLPPPPKSLGLPPPPPPSRTLPSPPSPSSKSNIRAPSPPPPTTKYGLSSSPLSSYTIPPPPPSMSKGNIPAPSPPPPPSMSKGNIPTPSPPPPPSMSKGNIPTPPPPPPPSMSKGNIPAPPPPPPPPPSGRGPPAPPPPPKGGVLGGPRPAVDPHAALLEHIRKGSGTLKKAEQSSPPPPSTDSRTQLLEDIKSRAFKLHKVEVEEVEMSEEESLGLEGIALDLHRALKERAQFIQPGDDEEDSSDDDDDDDEWDDDGF